MITPLCAFAPLRLCVKSENEISREIVSCAIEVHRTLGGPGPLESVCEESLAWELAQQGMKVDRQVSPPIHYNPPLVHMGRVVRATREASGPFGFGCIDWADFAVWVVYLCSAFLCALRGYFFLPESTGSQSGDQSTYLNSYLSC
ncbi:MAG: GxxExxY protein [Euryarchaeota archaeon]|nr:GxxExxY protein [Euryarchaeota archaeon]